MTNQRRIILGVPVDTYGPDEFLSRINKELGSSCIKTIFAINPEKIMIAQKNPCLFSALNEASYLIPDGIGTTIGIRVIYGDKVPRTTGIMLMQSLLNFSEKNGLKVFLFGSQPLTNRMATKFIKKEYPNLTIVGAQHGYLREKQYINLIEKINSLGADILFVGLGTPKQEEWIYKYKEILNVKICLGIGGSLDVLAGRIKRAPRSLQKLGLEWFYRLVKEPKRIKRQMNLSRFAFELLKEKIRA